MPLLFLYRNLDTVELEFAIHEPRYLKFSTTFKAVGYKPIVFLRVY